MKRNILLTIALFFTLYIGRVNAQIVVGPFPQDSLDCLTKDCQEVPICSGFINCFLVELYAPFDFGDGTSDIKWRITNYSESTFQAAAFDLPNGTPAIWPPDGSVFRNRYNHDVVNPTAAGRIRFNARNAGTFSYGGFEVYQYIVNNADLATDRTVSVRMIAGRPWQVRYDETIEFDLDVCEGGIIPLPVELMSFTGTPKENTVQLDWATAMEKNNEVFDVQRSMDGKRFESIGFVKGVGNSNDVQRYSFLDKTPEPGTNYYRLKQVDSNGRSEYHRVIAVNVKGGGDNGIQMTVAPNPVSNGEFSIQLNMNDVGNQPSELQVFDMNGRIIYRQRVAEGAKHLDFNTQSLGLKPGMYIITISAGDKKNSKKLVVQ